MITSFGIFLVLAVGAASYVVWRDAGREGYSEEKILDGFILSAFSAYFFSHLFYLLIFQEFSLRAAFRFWEGGHLFYGALFGALMGLYFVCRRNNWSVQEVGDIASTGALLALSIGNVGCGVGECNPPTPLLEAVFYLAAFFVISNLDKIFAGRKLFSGVRYFSTLILIAVFRLSIEFFRENQLQENLVFSVALLLCAVIGFYNRKMERTGSRFEELGLGLSERRHRNKSWRNTSMRNMPTMPNLPDFSNIPGSQLPKQFIDGMRSALTKQAKDLENQIKLLEKEDPFKDEDRADDNAEFMDDTEEQEGHLRINAQTKILRRSLNRIGYALKKIQEGTYGLSEKSGKFIGLDRLRANPTATLTKDEEEEQEQSEAGNVPPMERIS